MSKLLCIYLAIVLEHASCRCDEGVVECDPRDGGGSVDACFRWEASIATLARVYLCCEVHHAARIW